MNHFFVLTIFIFFSSCGDLNTIDEKNKKDFSKMTPVKIPISFSDQTSSLRLVDHHYKFTMKLLGCESGYVTEISSEAKYLDVFQGDKGCYLRLDKVTLDGVPLNLIEDFEDCQSGDMAVYGLPSSAEDFLKLKVISQLSNPIRSTDKIEHIFYEYKTGGDYVVDGNSIYEPKILSVSGNPSPFYNVSDIRLGSLFNGFVPLTFSLDCRGDFVLEGEDSICENQEYKKIDFYFLPKTEEASLEYFDLLFKKNGKSVSGRSILTESGFKLPLEVSIKDLIFNQEFYLILKNKSASYTYFILRVF